jgi:hypothetical protein
MFGDSEKQHLELQQRIISAIPFDINQAINRQQIADLVAKHMQKFVKMSNLLLRAPSQACGRSLWIPEGLVAESLTGDDAGARTIQAVRLTSTNGLCRDAESNIFC